MNKAKKRIGVVAPGSRLEPGLAEKVRELAEAVFPGRAELVFHRQCFLSSGHFAGDDATRAQAFIDVANDGSFDSLWFARGGYGACRIAPAVLANLSGAARCKIYLGYSDAGSLLGALYGQGFARIAHGPMPSDIKRDGGENAIKRALGYLLGDTETEVEATVSPELPSAAFNITILAHLIGTPFQPDLAGHVLMLEEVSEPMYRIDRALCQITSAAAIRQVAGIRLGRCGGIVPNDPKFGQTEEEVVRHWCQISGISYLGRADIGHDADNKIVPFGRIRPNS